MFSNLDRARVQYLFSVGAGRDLIRAFLDENRPRLLVSGAKFFKRGKGASQDLQFLLSLPEKAEPIVREWFLSKIKMEDMLAPEALIAQFAAVEDGTATMPAVQKKDCAAQGLAYLLQPSTPERWLEFLGRPIGKTDTAGGAPKPPMESGLSANEIAQAIIGASDDLEAVELGRFIEALVALKNGHEIKAEKALAKISNKAMRAALTASITAFPVETRVTGSGATAPIELESVEDVDVEKIQILARPSGRVVSGNPVFLTAVALCLNGQIYGVSVDQMKDLLDGNNAIIAFPNTKSVHLPSDHELGSWYVQKYPTPQPIKYRVVKPGNALYTVVNVPFSSANHDAVRTALQQFSMSDVVRPIFQLSDGLFVRLHDESTDLKRASFHEPLDLWHRLRTWNVDGQRIVLAPLPPIDERYDCADITAVIKRLIEQSAAARQLPQLSHAQVQAFVQALRSDPVDLTEARLRRVEHNFATFIDSRERLLSIVPTLLATTEVKSVMDAELDRCRAQFEAENGKLRAERGRLQGDISDLSERLVSISEENRRASRTTKITVRKAFEKAKEAGISALGDVAVFSALIHGPERAQTAEFTRALRVQSHPAHGPISQRLNEIGIPIIEAMGMERFCTACAKVGFVILFVGPLSAQMASSVAKGMSARAFALVDIPIGLTESATIDDTIESLEQEQPDVIVLRGCNLSPFEAYGTSICESSVERLRGHPLSPDSARPTYVLSAIDGPIALPIGEELRSVSVVLDSRHSISDAMDFTRLSDGRAFPGNRLKTSALARVLEELNTGDETARNAALAYLQHQLVE